MYKASEILSKPVINITSGNMLGTTKNLIFDKKLKKLEQIILFSEEDEIDELTLNPQNIYSIGKDAIIVKNEMGLTPLMFERINLKFNNPINSNAYNLEGEHIGIIKDLELNKNFFTTQLIINEMEYGINKITSFSNSTLLINTSGKKMFTSKQKLPQAKAENIQTVKIFPLTTNIQPVQSTQNISTEQTTPLTENIPTIENIIAEQPKKPLYIIDSTPTPERILANQSYLLGRKATKTIYGLNNEIIARKDSYITEKTLQKAKMHAKLSEIAVFSAIKK